MVRSVIPVVQMGWTWWNNRKKTKSIENYLKDECKKRVNKGQRTAMAIAAKAKVTVKEVEELSLKSKKIIVLQHVDKTTGRVDYLFYQYKGPDC